MMVLVLSNICVHSHMFATFSPTAKGVYQVVLTSRPLSLTLGMRRMVLNGYSSKAYRIVPECFQGYMALDLD